MSKPAISLIQTGLRDLNYHPGPVDGLFGARTRSAAEAWLKAGGIAAAVLALASAPALVLPVAVPQVATSGMIYQGKARYPVQEIVVHCSATPPSWMKNANFVDQVAEVRRWHMDERGWKDIGYHWLISRDGKVLAGRAETVIGAGVEGHNQGVIHICLIGGGGSASTDQFQKNFMPAQDITLRQMLQGIGMRTRVRRISGHNEWAGKACPGFNVPNWLKEAA